MRLVEDSHGGYFVCYRPSPTTLTNLPIRNEMKRCQERGVAVLFVVVVVWVTSFTTTTGTERLTEE